VSRSHIYHLQREGNGVETNDLSGLAEEEDSRGFKRKEEWEMGPGIYISVESMAKDALRAKAKVTTRQGDATNHGISTRAHVTC
jgi:hypothetical protein